MYWVVCILTVLVIYITRWILAGMRISNPKDKYVFITGCDSGFGNLLAKRLDHQDVHVFAGVLTTRGAEGLHTACSSRLVTVPLDVSKEDSIYNARVTVENKLPQGKGVLIMESLKRFIYNTKQII